MRLLFVRPAVLSALCVLSTIVSGQGDNRGPDGSLGDGAPAYTPEQLKDAMNDLAPGVGDAFVGDYKSGGFHFGELMVPVGPNGAADADTILIDSKYNDGDIKNDLVSCADFAIHEYMHWENCQGGSTEDPTTTDPSCGGCNHAGMHMLHLVAYLERACDGNSEIDYCELAWNNLYAAAQHMNTCDMDCPTFGSTDSILAFLDGGFDQCCE